MDGLSSIISMLDSFAGSNWRKLLTGGLFGAGEVGNILEQQKRSSYQNFVMDLLKNPAKLTQMATSMERPLDQSLTQSVGNTVQAQMAERGLAQAPGVFAATESQALAPYQQQNYQLSLNALLQSLGLPPQTFQQPSNNAGALQLFLKQFGNNGGSSSDDSPAGNLGGFNFPPAAPTLIPPVTDGSDWALGTS